jgi:hypothetical protein
MGLHSPVMRERREVTRYRFGLVGRLHQAGEVAGTNVVVQDIGTLGCALEHAAGMRVGKKCELYIDWQGTLLGFEARVVWKDAEGRAGLKFFSVDKDTQKRLGELCAALRAQMSSAPQPKEAETGRSLPGSATTAPLAPPAFPAAAAPSPPPRPARKWERRRVPRYISELRARVSNLATGATSSVTLVTLSVLGGCLEGPQLPEAGQKCELDTEWEGKGLLIQGDVVWKGREQAGVKFASLPEAAEKLLREICANLRLQPMAPMPPGPSSPATQ